jgi:hypothetical protein
MVFSYTALMLVNIIERTFYITLPLLLRFTFVLSLMSLAMVWHQLGINSLLMMPLMLLFIPLVII